MPCGASLRKAACFNASAWVNCSRSRVGNWTGTVRLRHAFALPSQGRRELPQDRKPLCGATFARPHQERSSGTVRRSSNSPQTLPRRELGTRDEQVPPVQNVSKANRVVSIAALRSSGTSGKACSGIWHIFQRLCIRAPCPACTGKSLTTRSKRGEPARDLVCLARLEFSPKRRRPSEF